MSNNLKGNHSCITKASMDITVIFCELGLHCMVTGHLTHHLSLSYKINKVADYIWNDISSPQC